MRCTFIIQLEERKLIHHIVLCYNYKGNVKIDGTYNNLVEVENEMKKEFKEFNTATEIIEIDEREFARLVNHFGFQNELLKEIEKNVNKLGDSSLYYYAKNFLNEY